MSELNRTLAAMTGLPDPLHERRAVPFPKRVDPLDTAEETLKVICHRLIDEIGNAANAHDDVALTLLEVRTRRIKEAFEAVESLATKYATDYRLEQILKEQK